MNSETISTIELLRQMVPGVRVWMGNKDQYRPSVESIELSPDTYIAQDDMSLLRAAHEGGHAIQHREGTLLWHVRDAWDVFATAVALSAAFALISVFAYPVLALISFGIAVAVRSAWGLAVVAFEREASEIAVRWMQTHLGFDYGGEWQARAYLKSLRRGYWRTVFWG